MPWGVLEQVPAHSGQNWASKLSQRWCQPAGRQGPGVFKVGVGLTVGGHWSPGASEGSASPLVGEAVFWFL